MLTDLSVNDFLNEVAAKEPIPGGGSVSALCGAIASALAEMVANLTIGKKGYEAQEELMKQMAEVVNRRRMLFTEDIDRDSDAYQKVFECFKMPKTTDSEKKERSAAIQDATKCAAIIPMEVARNAYALMGTIAEVASAGNKNAITDACVAMMTARTAVMGALLNVRINLGSLKDREFVREMADEAERLERKADEKERELLEAVKKELEV
ncbi:cyclodeaminase/cyclohydrolase family protein [Bacteroides sp. 224]|uniref:cyclodeaminase/cyclohydrolase family protein n=1 Tax=Bacteroides sp. 224 TaxID=2302936 RepID=UPI0013D208C8|nr:cyclodeaminase/cyclohydrolase family protein [Bacteroides sp. 224]NDV63873.1 methenyltetrahydrofolate cyclohydrolase [Bacteroides sp. 224]